MLLFRSTPLRHCSHFDYWYQPLNMSMRVCYLHYREVGLCCYLVIHIESLLRPLQLFYFHSWSIYWLSLVYIDHATAKLLFYVLQCSHTHTHTHTCQFRSKLRFSCIRRVLIYDCGDLKIAKLRWPQTPRYSQHVSWKSVNFFKPLKEKTLWIAISYA
jgi:hypothetical protein